MCSARNIFGRFVLAVCLIASLAAVSACQETQPAEPVKPANPIESPEPDSPGEDAPADDAPIANASPTTKDATKARSIATAESESESDSESWTVFRGNAQSTGVATSTLPAPEQLKVLWEFKVPNGAFEGTAAITREQKDASKTTVYIGDLDGSLFALDLRDGTKKWEHKVEIGFVTAPAVRNGNVFIGDLDGYFYCVGENGEPKWKFETQSEINSSANFYNELVLVGSQDSRLYALSEAGEKIWAHETQDQIRCSATIVDDRAFVAGCDGFLHIINLKTGKESGTVDMGSPTGVTPAVLGKNVYFGTEQGGFFAADWKTAKKRWVYEDPDGVASIRSCAAVKEGHVIFGSKSRKVISLNPKTGEENWATSVKSAIESSPVIVGELVYVAATDGRIYALNLEDGEIVWEKQFNGGFIGSPAVAFGRLVIASDRGVVYCLGKESVK